MSLNKMSNKVLMILLILFCFVLPITSLAVEKNTEYDSYSTEEIKQITQHTDEAILKRDKSLNKVDNTSITPYGTFYNEYPVSYNPNYVSFDRYAFTIGTAYFDTRGEYGNSTTIKATYSEQTTVNWSVSGTISASAEFNVLAAGVKAEASTTVSRSSSTSTRIGWSKDYNVATGRTGYIRIYAPGTKTGGAIKYKWNDRSGNSGYNYKQIVSTLPNSTTGIDLTFGGIVYD